MNKDNKMRLCLFWFPPGSHPGGWRMQDAIAAAESDFKVYLDVARLAEAAKIDAIFFADTAAVQPVDLIEKGDPKAGLVYRGAAGLEPMSLLPALAVATERIGLIATATTTYNEPYHIARRFATIDQISGGRGGWNLVTSQTEAEAQNFGHDTHMEHDARYERAEEFFDVVAGLWDSWADDACIYDKTTAHCFDPTKVRLLNHSGRYFKVRGPLNVLRSPQGRPIVVQAGASGPGKSLAARVADCLFTAQSELADGKAFYDELKTKAAQFGRRPEQVRIMPGIVPIIGRTDEEAQELRAQLLANITDDQALRSMYRIAGGLDLRKFPLNGPFPELPLSNGAQGRQKLLIEMARRENLSLIEAGRRFAEGQAHHIVCGSARTIADLMQTWFEHGACDGFALMPSYFPRGVRDIANQLVPELQRRGLFRTDYEGRTLRENLGLPRARSQFDT